MKYNSKTSPVDSAVFDGVIGFVNNTQSGIWSGTMTELSSNIKKVLGKKRSVDMPGSPSALRVVLNRLVNKIRKQKISVRFVRGSDRNRTRYVIFTR